MDALASLLALGLTQHQAAKALGVSGNFIGLLERGERMPGLSFANLVKRITGIPQDAWDEPAAEVPAADPA